MQNQIENTKQDEIKINTEFSFVFSIQKKIEINKLENNHITKYEKQKTKHMD